MEGGYFKASVLLFMCFLVFCHPKPKAVEKLIITNLRDFFKERNVIPDAYISRREVRESLPYAGASSDVTGPSSSSSGSVSSSVSSREADASDTTGSREESDSHVISDLEEQRK